jgi:hypothetical protein
MAMTVETLMTEAASFCETSVRFYRTTWRNKAEDRHLHAQFVILEMSHLTGTRKIFYSCRRLNSDVLAT